MTTAQSNEVRQKRKILFYNKFWNYEFPDVTKIIIPDFEILTEKEYKYKALSGDPDVDVVVFHVPSLDLPVQQLLKLKKSGQQWVYWSRECADHFADFKRPDVQALFDMTYTYELDADVPIPYIHFMPNEWLQAPVAKREFVNAFFTSSWDKSGRYDYLRELMSYLNIHSFGKFMNNRTLEQDPYAASGVVNNESLAFKKQVIARYKFTLAFENAIAKDYVTEKFFHPLQVGSVPVYLGAPNVENFAPGDNCYINVNSFSSVKELADYLLMLDRNDDQYNKYLEWKKHPLRESFVAKLNKGFDPFEIMLSKLREKFSEAEEKDQRVTGVA